MILEFSEEKEHLYPLLEHWTALEEAGKLPETMNHFELMAATRIQSDLWKEFLIDPNVVEQLQMDQHLKMRQKTALLLAELNADSKSTGVAQLLNTMLNSTNKKESSRESGPRYVYVFVPLNPQQKHAPNVVELDHNPFLKEEN